MPEETLAPPRHEQRDIGGAFAVRAVALVASCLIATMLVLAWIYPWTTETRTVPSRLPASPVPALQSSPRSDMARFYADEMQQLNSTGWIDKKAGRVHMPIEEAMRRIAAEGILGWPEPGK